jgi:hypothetical protein
MIRRFVTNVDQVTLAAAAAALAGHGVLIEHVAHDPAGLRHLDIDLPELVQEGN